MAPHIVPIFGQPNYDWPDSHYSTESPYYSTENPYYTTENSYYSTENYPEDNSKVEDTNSNDLGQITFWYMMVLIIMLITWMIIFFCLRLIALRQKTRSTQQRRVYVPGTRQRQLSVQGEPTIFVSPANLPPPPKYEAMAPPSYEEVMGVHYPSYQRGQQPITQPLTHALAHNSASTEPATNNVTINVTNNVVPPTTVTADAPAIVTVTSEERRPSVAVRA